VSSRPEQKSAFVAIVGLPNVGKSSLMNALLGSKVSIVSRKPQTTRTRVLGVLTEGDDQLVFFDTPGLLKPRSRLDGYMLQAVEQSVAGVDACLLVTEAGRKISDGERRLAGRLRDAKMPALLAVNKIDLLPRKSALMAQIAAWAKELDFAAVVPVSARTGSGIGDLKDELQKRAAPGGHFFDDDALTDQPERVLAAEIIREKLLRLLSREVPHGAAVSVERMSRRPGNAGITDVTATIYCEKESQKGIIIGKGGAMLKKIGTFARADMEKFFGCRINLKLWVRVREDWRNRESALRALGYDRSQLKP
jgi:GTP-binding protein Era